MEPPPTTLPSTLVLSTEPLTAAEYTSLIAISFSHTPFLGRLRLILHKRPRPSPSPSSLSPSSPLHNSSTPECSDLVLMARVPMTREGFDPMVLRLLGIMRTLGHRNVLHLGHEITVPSPQSSSGVVLVIPHIPHSLADVTAHYDRLSVPFLRSVMLQVILAVRHYHLRGVVHGSPSRPSLILLQPNGHVLLAPSERTHVLGHVDLALRGAALDDDWMHVAQLLYSLFVTSTTSNSNSTNSNSHSTNSSSSSVFHYAVAVVPGLVELYAALQSRPVAIEAILQENEFLRGVVKVPVPEVPFSFSSLSSSSSSSSSSSASTTSPSAVAAAASSMTTAPQMSLLVPPQWRHGSSPPPSGSPS